MAVEFNLKSEINNNVLIVETEGYVNNIGGQKIVEEFNKHYPSSVNFIILNLAKSKVVNSIGISFLIEIIEKLNKTKGKMIFTNLEPAVEKTFTIMGLFHFAFKAATVEEALTQI